MINEQWALLAIVGFWGWVFSAIGLILRAFPGRQLFIRRAGALWGGGVVFFFCVWVIGMLNA